MSPEPSVIAGGEPQKCVWGGGGAGLPITGIALSTRQIANG